MLTHPARLFVSQPVAHNDSECLLGHYNGTCATCDKHLECG